MEKSKKEISNGGKEEEWFMCDDKVYVPGENKSNGIRLRSGRVLEKEEKIDDDSISDSDVSNLSDSESSETDDDSYKVKIVEKKKEKKVKKTWYY